VGFPEPPRRVRLCAAAALWWPFGLTVAAALLAVTVLMLVILAQDGFRMPFADWRLDAEGVVGSTARVLAVRATGSHFGSQVVHEVDYSFDPGDGNVLRNTCYTLGRRYEPGAEVAVEYLPGDHAVLRLRRSSRAESALWAPFLLPFWLGLFLLTGFWWSRVYRLRVMLRHGPAAPATLVMATPMRGVHPPQLRVRYEFTTSAGSRQQGRHWVRKSGLLGRRLQGLQPGAAIPDAAAVYDEARPARSRLVVAEDAEPER
jgi:hypothetical protein